VEQDVAGRLSVSQATTVISMLGTVAHLSPLLNARITLFENLLSICAGSLLYAALHQSENMPNGVRQ
jgi:hypothetical protein